MRTATGPVIMVLGLALSIGYVIFTAVRLSVQPPKPVAAAYTANFVIKPPAKAVTLDHDTGELQYRTEVNQATIDALMDVEGVTYVSGATYGNIYELRVYKAKAFTWQEIDALLVDAGLLEAKR